MRERTKEKKNGMMKTERENVVVCKCIPKKKCVCVCVRAVQSMQSFTIL